MEVERPNYIVVEGPIGIGKTTLARRLAESFGSELLLEGPEDNPFLDKFYRDPGSVAFQTQLFFLFQRAQQMHELKQGDMFQPVRVADFIMEKDRLFAEITLDADEFRLYQQVYEHLTVDAPTPDLVIYLQAPTDILLKRIGIRGRKYERHFDAKYLQRLAESYMRFFHDYHSSPLLIVNAAEIDLANNDEHYQMLLEQVLKVKSGRHYFNPTSVEL